MLNCGYKISKRVWSSLIASTERINYKNFEPPTKIIAPHAIHSPLEDEAGDHEAVTGADGKETLPVFSRNGITYDVSNLVSQSEKYAKAQNEIKELQALYGLFPVF